MQDVSSEFARRILEIRDAGLETADYHQVGRLLFDFAACAYSGSQQDSAKALRKWAERYAGAGHAGVIGGSFRVPAPVAALANGTAAHSYELDDTHDSTLSHPASVVISAALAAAAETNCTGQEFVAAIVAGYEAMARVGLAANAAEVIEFGFHPTAVFGGFGAASAAAAIQKLSREQLLCAWGHVLSMAAGSMQFSDETDGTAIKRVHPGFAAQQGILAVELAQVGVDAPRRALDGKYGFFKLYARNAQPELLNRSGAPFAIHRISFKPYACCRQFHSVVDALDETTQNFSRTSDIVSLTVRGPRVLGDQHMLRRPTSPMAAQYSLPFVVGATLEFGPSNYSAFAPENLGDAEILRWADLVKVEFDQELQSKYPDHFGSEVEVMFADGKVRTERVLDSRGTPARPFSWQHLRDKAANLTADCRPPLDLQMLEATVTSLREAENVHAFEGLLGREITSLERTSARSARAPSS